MKDAQMEDTTAFKVQLAKAKYGLITSANI